MQHISNTCMKAKKAKMITIWLQSQWRKFAISPFIGVHNIWYILYDAPEYRVLVHSSYSHNVAPRPNFNVSSWCEKAYARQRKGCNCNSHRILWHIYPIFAAFTSAVDFNKLNPIWIWIYNVKYSKSKFYSQCKCTLMWLCWPRCKPAIVRFNRRKRNLVAGINSVSLYFPLYSVIQYHSFHVMSSLKQALRISSKWIPSKYKNLSFALQMHGRLSSIQAY